jgi:hypothetical protein
MSKKDIARLLALVILFSSLFALRINWSFVTNWNAYDNLAGQIQALSTLSFWITITGAALLVTDRRIGYWILVAGTVLAIIGQGFSYVPFVPWFGWNPVVGLVLMHATNLAVVALIGFYYLKVPQPEAAS